MYHSSSSWNDSEDGVDQFLYHRITNKISMYVLNSTFFMYIFEGNINKTKSPVNFQFHIYSHHCWDFQQHC